MTQEEHNSEKLPAIAEDDNDVEEEPSLKIKAQADIIELDGILNAEITERHEYLIGQLKAAEAKNRLRAAKYRSAAKKKKEIKFLVMCQSTAASAARLEALLPIGQTLPSNIQKLDKITNERIKNLMKDME